MNTIKRNLSVLSVITLLLIGSVALDGCKKDDDALKGKATIKMTDAPVDNAEVKGVFVTVTDVKVDGESVEGFSKTTFDLSAYQNGETETIFSDEIEANSYSEITLVFDNEKDENGDSPGTYVLKEDNSKDRLSANSTSEFTVDADMEITEDGQSSTVIDFDLRKAIQLKNNDDYEFSSNSTIVVRAVNETEAGSIEGTAKDESTDMEGHIVVYAYKKGDFEENAETSGEVMFEKSVSSAMVDANGSYKLAFLDEGEYEVYFANYTDKDKDGKFEFEGMIEVKIDLIGSLFSTADVKASSSTTLNVSLNGIL